MFTCLLCCSICDYQLTEYRLQRGGYKCGKLTGSLNVDQRDKVRGKPRHKLYNITILLFMPKHFVFQQLIPNSYPIYCDIFIQIIQSFNTDPDMNVLLISLKAGGVALNLTAANHIFIMDPWWNPAAEMQVTLS